MRMDTSTLQSRLVMMNRKIMERRKETILINNGKKYILYSEYEKVFNQSNNAIEMCKKIESRLNESQRLWKEKEKELMDVILRNKETEKLLKDGKLMTENLYSQKKEMIKQIEKEMESISTYRLIQEGKMSPNTVNRFRKNPAVFRLETMFKILSVMKKLKKA